MEPLVAYDRDEVLAHTDLALLADELLGPHRGRGRSATWPCPDPGHGPQTGRTPPVSVFDTSRDYQRWHCHGCGVGGTAADLLMTVRGVGFGEALEELARRAGVADRPWSPDDWSRVAPRPRDASTGWRREPGPEIETYVTACEAHLWSRGGRATRRWLADRGFGDEVLLANRVGSDPGPERLARPEGLPRGGRAAVFPVLGNDDRAVYVQARYLWPRTHKYDNPSSALAGPSPRIADLRLASAGRDDRLVVIAEGIPDGLTAAQAGYRSVAVLGAGLPDPRIAIELRRRFPSEQLVIAFDADHRGKAGAAELASLLEGRGLGDRVAVLRVPPEWSDLNGWLMGAGPAFGSELAGRLDEVLGPPDRSRLHLVESPGPATGVAPQLSAELAAIHYRFVLGAEPADASANLARVDALVAEWDASPPAGAPLRVAGDDLTEAVKSFCYRHLLSDDGRAAVHQRDQVSTQIDRWSAELEPTRTPPGPDLDRPPPAHDVLAHDALAPIPPEPPSMEIGW